MKTKLIFSLLALSGFLLLPARGLAQDSSRQERTAPSTRSDQKSSDVRTLTGCLEKGEKSGEYKLIAEDGSTWEVKGDKAKLAEHIGHTVTVTGAVSHPEMHGVKEKAKSEVSDANERGRLTVTNVKMDSDSCKK
jgi:hypothetical protein